MKKWYGGLQFKQFCGCISYCKNNHCAFRRFSFQSLAQRSADDVIGLDKTDIHFYPRSLLLHRAIDWSVEARDLCTGKMVLAQLVKLAAACFGLTSIWNKVISLWCKCGDVEFAHHVFDQMPSRDAASYNTLISVYVRTRRHVFEIVRFYLRMVNEGVQPNHITFGILIAAFGDTVSCRLLEVFHGLVLKLGFSANAFVGSSIVDGCAKQLRLDDGLKAFNEIAEADLVSWNILIDGCARNKSTIQAFQNFGRMVLQNVLFDEFTLTSILKTCAEPKDLYCGVQIHCCVVKFGFCADTATGNSLMTMYAKCEEGMNAALKVFEEIQIRNVISWTAMITGLTQVGHQTEAIELYKRMIVSGVGENQFTFASIIPAIGKLANLEQGRQIHARAAKLHSTSDVSVNNTLIDMYSKCGNLDDARMLFGKMGKHDNVSYTAMITALGQHGMGIEALQILKGMTNRKLQPDDVTLLSCLSACSHSGLLDEGIVLFRSMLDVYHVKPRIEHFSCIVDMLGRAGKLSDAETFIFDMELDSDVFVWETLLGACKLHGEVTLGEKSAKKITELKPAKHEPYVLLSDVYSAKELWKDKGLVRDTLALKGLRKNLGGSWIH